MSTFTLPAHIRRIANHWRRGAASYGTRKAGFVVEVWWPNTVPATGLLFDDAGIDGCLDNIEAMLREEPKR